MRNQLSLKMNSMNTDVIQVDPEILGGTPVFRGTRVPIQSLFWHLESGINLDDFLEDFPSVTKEQAVAVLEMSGKIFSSGNFLRLYEDIA